MKMMTLPRKSIIAIGIVSGFFVMMLTTIPNRNTIINHVLTNNRASCSNEDMLSVRLVGALSQDDPELIEYIRKNHLWPPSEKPYNFSKITNEERSSGQADKVREILKDQKNGFFIECGATDGETYTNTLTLEQKLGWHGILIEASPKTFQDLVQKHRKAWTSNVCLSTKPYPEEVLFTNEHTAGMIISSAEANKTKKDTSKVQCLPLYSILLAMRRTTIDYFSLDIEGAELDVLKTIPFSKVDIKVMTVEYNHVKEGKDALKNFVEAAGYTTVGEVNSEYAADFLFVKNSIRTQIHTRK